MKTTGNLAILVVILSIGTSCVESGAWKHCGMNPLMGRKERRFIPKFINDVRRKEPAAAMMKLVWSRELARRAREQAVKCEFKQTITTDCSGRSMSQSMYMEAGALPGSVRVNWQRILSTWETQKEYYNHETHVCQADKNCGLYTMMVRDVNRFVGCSYARCPTVAVGARGNWTNAVLYVCNYRGTGRYTPGMYEMGEPCTDCAKLVNYGYVCEANLCDECNVKRNSKCTCIPKKCSKAGGRFSKKLCKCICKRGFWGDLCEFPCACKNTLPFCDTLPKKYCTQPSYYHWIRQNCAALCPKVCEVLKPPPRSRC